MKPYTFIKSAFRKTQTSPFGVKKEFGVKGDGYLSIPPNQLLRAALECGYGRRTKWTAQLVLSASECVELEIHLLARLQSVIACLESNAAGARVAKSFYRRLETSEKAWVSFVIGSMFAYLTAHMWFEAAGDKLGLFLHTSIYTKAIGTTHAAASFSSGTNQRPDFVVVSKLGNWCLFESKGGTAPHRWAQLYKGLQQLAGAPRVGWTSGPSPQPPQALVCVHTEVDAGKPLAVTAVDPPSNDGSESSDAGDSNAPVLTLIPGMCVLMLVLKALEQFRAMAADANLEVSLAIPGWTLVETRRFQGVVVGLPTHILSLEERFRATVACFLAVQDVLIGESAHRLGSFDDSLASVVVKELARRSGQDRRLVTRAQQIAMRLDNVPGGLRRALEPDDDFLNECAQQLGIGEIAEIATDEVQSRSLLLKRWDPEAVVTSGGLLNASSTLRQRVEIR